MEIKIVDEKGQVEKTEPVVEVQRDIDVSAPVDLNVIDVAQMLNLGLDEMKEDSDKIKTLIDWAKTQVDEPTMSNIKIAIRNLESRVGSPPLGEKRIDKIHRFAYLELQEQKLRKEKESMYV